MGDAILRRIGFMQGRLTPPVNGRIQCFPRENWRKEFELARRHGFSLMEWTLDAELIEQNPLLTREGQAEIRTLSREFGLAVPSITGDCFMQEPFWRHTGDARAQRLQMLFDVVAACEELEIGMVVIPLVDNGAPKNADETEDVVRTLVDAEGKFHAAGVRIAFESDLAPAALAQLIARFPERTFGVNYDIGNSASLGFNSAEELAAYGARVINVHVKDRVLGGTTVPLGTGNAKLGATLAQLRRGGFDGNYILQTARAADGDDVGAAVRYRDMTAEWLSGA